MYKILLADSDTAYTDKLTPFLTNKNCALLFSKSGKEVLETALVVTLDAVILCGTLQDISVFDVCRKLRDKTSVPVLFVKNLSTEEERIGGFMAGCDDFLTEPYSLEELWLRLCRRIETRRRSKQFEIFRFGKLIVDTGKRMVTYSDKLCDLTPIEFDIFAALAANPKKVFPYDTLYDLVWHTPGIKSKHTIQVHVARLRQKLYELTKSGNSFIHTANRKGYMFDPGSE